MPLREHACLILLSVVVDVVETPRQIHLVKSGVQARETSSCGARIAAQLLSRRHQRSLLQGVYTLHGRQKRPAGRVYRPTMPEKIGIGTRHPVVEGRNSTCRRVSRSC